MDLYDGIAALGLFMLGIGLGLIRLELGLIVAGALLLILGVGLGLLSGRQGGTDGDHKASG